MLVEGEGFEPSKAEPSDLQSDPFDRSGTPPAEPVIISGGYLSIGWTYLSVSTYTLREAVDVVIVLC
jgi:hypothetical protein